MGELHQSLALFQHGSKPGLENYAVEPRPLFHQTSAAVAVIEEQGVLSYNFV